MKKLRLVIIILFMFLLTGCIKEYNLSEENSDIAAEYMAGLLLKYDKNYEAGLTSLDDIQAENKASETNSSDSSEADVVSPTPAVVEDTDVNTSDVTASPEKNYTLTEVIGEEDFDIQYSSYKICASYPEDSTDGYFSLTPREGNQLLVTTFTVKNISGSEKNLDISNSQIKYQLDINVGTMYEPLFSLLENDLHYFDMTIGAGDTKTALLVFEISGGTDITSVNLIVSKGDKSEIIEAK